MALRREDVERLLGPAFVEGIGAVSLAELRQRRDQCLRAEVVVSYLRRVLQGELDLLRAEATLRADGDRGDLGRLVAELPNILTRGPEARRADSGAGAPADGAGVDVQAASNPGPTGSPAHLSLVTMPSIGDAWTDEAAAELDDLIASAFSSELIEGSLPGGTLPGANLHTFSDDELAVVAAALEENETSLSDIRKRLHRRIDELQAAIVDRYKSGAASADSLLT